MDCRMDALQRCVSPTSQEIIGELLQERANVPSTIQQQQQIAQAQLLFQQQKQQKQQERRIKNREAARRSNLKKQVRIESIRLEVNYICILLQRCW